MKEVEFIKEFAGQKIGTIAKYSRDNAMILVSSLKVAKYYIKDEAKPKKEPKTKK